MAEEAMDVVINQLTGQPTTLQAFLGKRTALTDGPKDIGVLRYLSGWKEGTPVEMYMIPLSDVSDSWERQEEILDLLQLGLGGVDKDRNIWLVKSFVDTIYTSNDKTGLLKALATLIKGTKKAIEENHMPTDIHMGKSEDQDLMDLAYLLEEVQKLIEDEKPEASA